ncbi:MAG: hypothetical protein ABIP97_12115 [Chthoniobacterales bacterium]
MATKIRNLKLSELFFSPRFVPSAIVYSCGLGLLLITCIMTNYADPSGIYGTSWFDSFEIPLVGLSFILCLIAPFFAPVRKADRLVLFALGVGGFVIWSGLSAVVYIVIYQFLRGDAIPTT